MLDFLCHYYDESTGPFRNLSDLKLDEAERILDDIRLQGKGFASQRSPNYLDIRRQLESTARDMFIGKGGMPIRNQPHYMTYGQCSWLLNWYTKGREIQIPITEFDPLSISFTYGDLFPTMRYLDGKAYRGKIYTMAEIYGVIDQYGLPQEWNPDGELGPERYIEVQVWDDHPVKKYMRSPLLS